MAKTISELVNDLPTRSVTVYVLESLDFVVPGEWENLVGFENTIKRVTGEEDPELIRQVAHRANVLYNDPSQGYQRAMWLYQTVDRTDLALGAAALANRVGGRIRFLSFLERLTPKADTAQTIDLSMKLVVELLAFCKINGIPGDSISDFVKSLADYSGESLMRMAALVCVDGLVPLGPDFLQTVVGTLEKLSPAELEKNDTFKRIRDDIPGVDALNKLQFIGRSFDSVTGWMSDFVSERDLSPKKVIANLQKTIDISDDRLDYLGAFLDITTNYYTHTGTQTLARRLIERAVNEI
jgi:hypothetical protein